MLFTQIEFVLLLAACLGASLILPATPRKVALLAASYYFYAYWDWRFTGLLLLSTTVDYLVGLSLDKTDEVQRRRALLGLSLVVNLGILSLFKYFDFFVESFATAFASLAPNHAGGASAGFDSLQLILPVGISFYTFQTLSYTIDVYRRRIPTCRSPLDFALFVAFFPQLVAGPIVRARDFLPQLRSLPALGFRDSGNVRDGSRRMILGFFKKVFVADNLARFVDIVYQQPELFDTPTLWLATLAFSLQIYCDFSGYSDMAIGCARILGFRFPENFNFPYLASSFSEFWQRWHISLSSWLRDYLYISLGGNRRGTWRTYRNLMTTMLLGGLWHGAAWTYVGWGALHGTALVLQRLLGQGTEGVRRRLGAASIKTQAKILPKVPGWLGCQFIVILAWVFFRANSLNDALVVLRRLFHPAAGLQWIQPQALAFLGAAILVHLLAASRWGSLLNLDEGRWWQWGLLGALFLAPLLYHPDSFQPFLYFRF